MESALDQQYYFCEEILKQEKECLFFSDDAPQWFGHTTLVPNPGDYFVLPHTGEAYILTNDEGTPRVVSNFCRHRHAKMCEDAGNSKKLVCPVHAWSYGLDGSLSNSPGIACDPTEHSLPAVDVRISNGMIHASGNRSIPDAFRAATAYTDMPFETLQYFGKDHVELPIGWKEYVETYLDNYHLRAYHPGLTGLVDPGRIDKLFEDRFQIQCIGVRNPLKPTAGFEKYLEAYERCVGEFDSRYGAVWFCIYPNIIVEVYQEYMIFSLTMPVTVNSCRVQEYYFCTENGKHQEVIDAFLEFMTEVELEDHDIMRRVHAGRLHLHERQETHTGPYHPELEDGLKSFHEYWKAGLGV